MTEASAPDLDRILATLEAAAHRKRFRRWAFFAPYPKQKEFLALGATKRERLLMAGNRVGKTEVGAFEAACHATGEYPEWWVGRRFEKPTRGWVCGETSLLARDVCQTKLCGDPGVVAAQGTGMIPKDAIVDTSLARGITDAYDTLQVRHKSGGISIIRFKSYEQGRTKFQGEGLHWIWFDEEPPLDVYSEGLTRIGELDGLAFVTFTPLRGPTEVVLRYTDEPSPDRAIVGMTLDDIPPGGHLSAEAKKKMVDGYLPHQREARALGLPMMGEGKIFTCTEASITEAPIERVPDYWRKIWGVDFGIGHPFGAALILWDVDNDVIHVHHVIRVADQYPINHAFAMRQIGAAVPVAWPTDGTVRRDDGKPLSDHYKRHGLRMLGEHATWPDGSVSTEAGVIEMDERMRSGRFKVAAHLTEFFEEYRSYHRKDGKIVKLRDDVLSATRVAVMSKRYAKNVLLGSRGVVREASSELARSDFDVFTGM